MTPPSSHPITARDLLLSADLTVDDARTYLASRGFRDSDLDLVFVCRGKPGDGALFYRCETLVKQLYQFLEAPTSEGIAYRLDTRLRPEGSTGALALPVDKFAEYLVERAER